jgi:sterol 24-C-methyltransferase
MLEGRFTPEGFRMTKPGRIMTNTMVTAFEALGIAPKGSKKVSDILNATAIDLVDGGKLNLFTPSYFYLARKK